MNDSAVRSVVHGLQTRLGTVRLVLDVVRPSAPHDTAALIDTATREVVRTGLILDALRSALLAGDVTVPTDPTWWSTAAIHAVEEAVVRGLPLRTAVEVPRRLGEVDDLVRFVAALVALATTGSAGEVTVDLHGGGRGGLVLAGVVDGRDAVRGVEELARCTGVDVVSTDDRLIVIPQEAEPCTES